MDKKIQQPKMVKCPGCGKSVEWNDKSRWRPFCSERCRLIDLGEWASEGHRIAGTTPEDFSENDIEEDPGKL